MFDLFVRLIRVDLYVRFFVRFHVRFLRDFFVRLVLVRLFSDFFVRFHLRLLSDFLCLIFLSDFYMSDFLYPILLSHFFPIYFVRLAHARFFVLYSLFDSFVLFYVQFILSDVFMSDFLFDISGLVRLVLDRFFFWFFDPISCPIFARLLSHFLCPICFIRFFCANFFVLLVHVRFFVLFSLSDSFVLFLSDLFCPTCSCPIFCPIFFVRFLALYFVRFDVSSFCPIFCALFLADLSSHFWGWFLVKKDRTCRVMYCHLCHVLSMCQEFLLLWQYCITARMGVIKSHNSIMALSVI